MDFLSVTYLTYIVCVSTFLYANWQEHFACKGFFFFFVIIID